jgi:hypothetical protein
VYARKLDREMAAADVCMRLGDVRWPRYRRVAFLAAAASLCWAVPIVVAYLIAAA